MDARLGGGGHFGAAGGDRNPVSYRSLEELGINPEALKWEDMPEAENAVGSAEEIAPILREQ